MSSKTQSSELDTRTFLLTVSVKGDLSIDSQEEIVKWIRKNTLMNYVVIEHGESGKRHLHAILVFKEPRIGKKIRGNLWDRHVKPFHSDSRGSVAVVVTVCYSNDWYNTYLKKESGVEVLSSNYDPDEAETYFPSAETQELLMATRDVKGVACPYLEHDVAAWAESDFPNEPAGALAWLKHRMYVLKNMIPISCKRKLTEKAQMYWEYRNQIVTASERELWLLKQLSDGPTYDVPCRDSSRGAAPSI